MGKSVNIRRCTDNQKRKTDGEPGGGTSSGGDVPYQTGGREMFIKLRKEGKSDEEERTGEKKKEINTKRKTFG